MSIVNQIVAAPIAENLTIEEAFEVVESHIFDLIDRGEVTFDADPEAREGHLDRSYYNNPLWLTDSTGEIDIFSND